VHSALGAGGATNTSNSLGLFCASRTSSSSVRAYQNNSGTTVNVNSDSLTSSNVYLGALNDKINSRINYGNRQLAFSTIGDGLTDTDAANLYTIVQKYQTTLGRQV
jgi:hypothetical protein